MKKNIKYFMKVVLISVLTLNLLGCNATVKSGVVKNTNEQTKENIDQIEQAKEKLNTLCTQLIDQDEEGISKALKDFKENTLTNVDRVYFAKEDSKAFYAYPNAELPEAYDARTRYWYMKAKDNEYYISEYADALNNKSMVTLAKALYKDEVFIGVVGVDIIKEKN